MKAYARRTPEQWESLVNDQQASELSAPEYCKLNDIAYASFSKWRTKLKPANDVAISVPTAAPFVELTSSTNEQPFEPQWLIELDLAPGVQLRIAR